MLLVAALAMIAPGFAVAGGQKEASAGAEAEGDGQEVNYLGVAAVMIRDGNYDRAEQALSQVNTEAGEFNAKRYYTLRGLLSLRQGDYAGAVEHFEEAIAHGQDDPTIDVYLAQAQYYNSNYEGALESVNSVSQLGRYPDLMSLKAEAQWQLDRRDQAYETITQAIELFPSRTQYLRQRITYLIRMNLTQEAAAQSEQFLEKAGDDADAYVTIGEALRRGGQTEAAIRTLEVARMRFPEHEQVKLALAQAYLDKGLPITAGDIVARAAAQNFELYHEAAEIYRRAGELKRALFLNSQVPDEAKKTRQRFHLLLAMERYEQALALEPRLERIGALSEDSIRYAAAYALFQTSQFERAVDYLNQISSSEYFGKATQLRNAIETVRSKPVKYF
jgi:tetratricopeptide (TPR) repeat protein